LILQTCSSYFDRAQNRTERHGGRPLNVVVKGQELVAIAFEDWPRMRVREILPLQARLRKFLFYRGYELLDKSEVVIASDPLVTPSEVLRIFKSLGIVSSHVQQNRQCSFRTNPTDQRVKGKFSDRDPESAHTLITDTKNAFTIRHNDDIDIRIRPIPQDLDNGIALGIPNEHAARSAVNVTELLARQRNRWRVDNRRHFLDVLEKKAIKEDLVVILQSTQIDVTLQIVVFSAVGLISAHDLFLQCFDVRRKQSVETKLLTLSFAERGAFVQQWRIEQIHSARNS
jgi:hypothetical protein